MLKLKFDVRCDFPHYHTTFSENVSFFEGRYFVTDSLFPTSRTNIYLVIREREGGGSINNNTIRAINNGEIYFA